MARLIDKLLPQSERGIDFSVTSQIAMVGDGEPSPRLTDFDGFVKHGYFGNGPIWSLIQVRAQALSEIEFAFQDLETGELSGPVDRLKEPWPGGSAGDLETAIEVDVSLDGNAFIHGKPRGRWLSRLRPDLVDIVVGVTDFGRHAVGYLYYPHGRESDPVAIPVEEMAHIAPMPDPSGNLRGVSWIQAVAREGDADTLMTKHKGKFFENGTTPTMAVVAKSGLNPEQRKALKAQFGKRHESWTNAYKTIYIEGDADVKTVGQGLDQISFSQVQGKGESRLAAAANVPPILVGFSEGMQAGTYSNYDKAFRRFADLFCRPRWRQDAEALGRIVPVPAGHRLWFDDRRISFLQQDAKDAADIRKADASTLESLIRGGFTPESAAEAVTSGRFDRLEHTGLVSVQLQPPGVEADPADPLRALADGLAPYLPIPADSRNVGTLPVDDGDPDD